MWAPCLFRGRIPVPLKKVANGDIWFLTERDWSQGCCHGNNIVGVILCLLWCTLLVPSLKITAAIFLEIFLIQYRTLSHNAETKDFARPTSHSVRRWTGKNKAFCSPGTQNGRRVIKVYFIVLVERSMTSSLPSFA